MRQHYFMKQLFIWFCILLVCSCNGNSPVINADTTAGNDNPAPAIISYTIIKVFPHDTSSYTQGLELYNNILYEGTGDYQHSKLKKDDINTGKSLQEISTSNDSAIFGEGITVFNHKIYELTWEYKKVFVYDINTFKKINEFNWPFEGWGLTHTDKELIVSTGGSNLYFVNPENFSINKTVGVTDNNGPVSDINELEYINGYIFANVYQTNYIIKINPATGRVEGKIDLSGLLDKSGTHYDPSHIDVLNGIAWDSAKNNFYITGKWWPALFEIKLN